MIEQFQEQKAQSMTEMLSGNYLSTLDICNQNPEESTQNEVIFR